MSEGRFMASGWADADKITLCCRVEAVAALKRAHESYTPKGLIDPRKG